MSSGPSLYRRHRPRTFSDVVGQEHVVRTLRNALERGKVHHAYLFVGSRGTGKTSMAKILAACLNCEHGPTIEPCGVCESCVSIANATSLDVIEMDAASNNSVDDIRDLRERVGYAPVSGRHKVYILDEAHMLSSQAWNAFLKTLEEPPPRTIFVLATTEAQKVLATVVDRCHRFDFGRPSVEQVTRVLQRVADQEGIDVDAAALALVARHATGSFRDALGTLEQLVTYVGDRRIEADDVLSVLGIADAELLFAAVDAIVAGDPAEAVRTAARLVESGRDPGQVLRDLEVHGRELLTAQILGDVPGELRLTPEHDRRLLAQAQALSDTDAVRLLDLISAALEATSNGAQARIQLDLLLARAAAPQMDPSVAALMARVQRLEAGRPAVAPPSPAARSAAQVAASADGAAARAAALGDDLPTVTPPSPPSTPAPGPAPAPPGPSPEPPAPAPPDPGPDPSPPTPGPDPGPGVPAPGPTPAPGFATASTAAASPNGTPTPGAPAAAHGRLTPAGGNSTTAANGPAADGTAADGTAADGTAANGTAANGTAANGHASASSAGDLAGTTVPSGSPAANTGPGAPPGTVDGTLSLEAAAAAWPAVVDLIRGQNAMLAALLTDARPVAVREHELTIAFPAGADFLKRKAEQEEHRRVAADALRAATGQQLALRYELGTPATVAPAVAAPAVLSGEELVRRFLEEFDAEEISEDDHHEAEVQR